jgi:peroxiredoxin
LNGSAPPLATTSGEPFPAFELRTCRDRPCTLEPRSAIVIFYRGHWCGHCRDQLTHLAREINTFRALGVRLVAISADDFVGANDMCNDTGAVIDILSDPDASAIQQLGLSDREVDIDHVIARPAVYIVDSEGIVRYRYVSRSATDRPTNALLALAAESLSRPRRKESMSA